MSTPSRTASTDSVSNSVRRRSSTGLQYRPKKKAKTSADGSADTNDAAADEDESKDDSYECAICLCEFQLPFVTRCKHTFCYLCLKGVLQSSQQRCPLCRADIDVQHMQTHATVAMSEFMADLDNTYVWRYSGRNGGFWLFEPSHMEILERGWTRYREDKAVRKQKYDEKMKEKQEKRAAARAAAAEAAAAAAAAAASAPAASADGATASDASAPAASADGTTATAAAASAPDADAAASSTANDSAADASAPNTVLPAADAAPAADASSATTTPAADAAADATTTTAAVTAPAPAAAAASTSDTQPLPSSTADSDDDDHDDDDEDDEHDYDEDEDEDDDDDYEPLYDRALRFVPLSIGAQDYTVDMERMVQYPTQHPSRTRKVDRILKEESTGNGNKGVSGVRFVADSQAN